MIYKFNFIEKNKIEILIIFISIIIYINVNNKQNIKIIICSKIIFL